MIQRACYTLKDCSNVTFDEAYYGTLMRYPGIQNRLVLDFKISTMQQASLTWFSGMFQFFLVFLLGSVLSSLDSKLSNCFKNRIKLFLSQSHRVRISYTLAFSTALPRAALSTCTLLIGCFGTIWLPIGWFGGLASLIGCRGLRFYSLLFWAEWMPQLFALITKLKWSINKLSHFTTFPL